MCVYTGVLMCVYTGVLMCVYGVLVKCVASYRDRSQANSNCVKGECITSP